MEDRFVTGCRGLSFLLTYTGPNEFKFTIHMQETSLYKIIAAFVLDGLVFGSSGAPKLDEIIAVSVILAVFSDSVVHFIVCLYSSYCLKCAQINSTYVGYVPLH